MGVPVTTYKHEQLRAAKQISSDSLLCLHGCTSFDILVEYHGSEHHNAWVAMPPGG